MGGDEFATPAAPPMEPPSQRLSNSDFRKLMMTPRAGGGSTPFWESGGGGSTPANKNQKKDSRNKLDPNKAAERRDGGEVAPAAGGAADDSSTGAYRAVAPNARDNHDAAERRRQMIQESKYLGGDMEHTHLVKGLDFALLQKVRSEISVREAEQETA